MQADYIKASEKGLNKLLRPHRVVVSWYQL